MSYPAQYEALYDAAHQDVTQTVRYALSLSSAIHNLEVETQDVCQSCWLAAWRALEQGRDITPGWMHTVAQRAASNYRRGQQFEQGLFAFSIDEPVIDSAGEESSFLDSHIPDGALDKPDVRPERLMRALSQLPPAHSEIVFAHYLEKEPLHDIAMGLGISTAAARKRLQRATADVVAIVGRDGFHQILAA